MKHILSLTCALLLLGSTAAQAQLGNLVGAGVNMARHAKTDQQKASLFVVPTSYQGHTFPQKRTPAKKIPKASQGGTEIVALEQLLADRFAALQADSTTLLLDVSQEKEFSRLRSNLEAFNPFWNTDPYSQEMNAYRQHDVVRQRLARAIAPR